MAKAKRKPEFYTTGIRPPEEGQFKIHLACGSKKEEGFIGIDENTSADHFVELRNYPWPIEDAVVDTMLCGDHIQKLPALERFSLLDECWRVLKVGGQITIVVPARGSNRSMMDPFYQYPPIVEDFFYFANKEWRDMNGYSHYPVKCDFDWTYGFAVDDEIKVRNEEMQRMAIKFLRNAAHEMLITMTKR